MRAIEGRPAPLISIIEEILRDLRTRRDHIVAAKGFVVVAEIRAPRVVRADEETFRHTLIELHITRVVFARRRRLEQSSWSPVRIQSTNGHAVGVAGGNDSRCLLRCQNTRIRVALSNLMVRAIPDVAELQNVVGVELSLYRQ